MNTGRHLVWSIELTKQEKEQLYRVSLKLIASANTIHWALHEEWDNKGEARMPLVNLWLNLESFYMIPI